MFKSFKLNIDDSNRLAKKAKKGNRSAFDQLVVLYDNFIYLKFESMFSWQSHHAIEDLCQETWLRVYEKIDDFDEDKGSFKFWLAGFARNVAFEHTKRLKRRGETGVDADIQSEENDGSLKIFDSIDTLLNQERKMKLMELIRELPDTFRDVLIRSLDDCELTEVADKLGIEYHTVYRRYTRGIEQLKEKFAKRYPEL